MTKWLGIVVLVYILLIGVQVIGVGFGWISGGTEGAERIFSFATNPLVSVILGVLATALLAASAVLQVVTLYLRLSSRLCICSIMYLALLYS